MFSLTNVTQNISRSFYSIISNDNGIFAYFATEKANGLFFLSQLGITEVLWSS
jgi:hypothetical protein